MVDLPPSFPDDALPVDFVDAKNVRWTIDQWGEPIDTAAANDVMASYGPHKLRSFDPRHVYTAHSASASGKFLRMRPNLIFVAISDDNIRQDGDVDTMHVDDGSANGDVADIKIETTGSMKLPAASSIRSKARVSSRLNVDYSIGPLRANVPQKPNAFQYAIGNIVHQFYLKSGAMPDRAAFVRCAMESAALETKSTDYMKGALDMAMMMMVNPSYAKKIVHQPRPFAEDGNMDKLYAIWSQPNGAKPA